MSWPDANAARRRRPFFSTLSERARRRALKAVTPKLHATSQPLAYALAVGGPPPRRTMLTVFGAAAGASVALSALAGTVVTPGWLFFLAYWAFNPPRSVVTTSNSVVVTDRSIFNGRPGSVREVAPLWSLLGDPVERSGGWARYAVGDEAVWLRGKEARRVVAAVEQLRVPA